MSSCAAPVAFSQGLLSIRAVDEEFESIPFTTTVSTAIGYDSNYNSSAINDDGSFYAQAGFLLGYATGNRTTSYNLGGSFNTTYYESSASSEEFFYNARVNFGIRHRATSKLTISDRAYVAYEFEPDYEIGASTSRRNDQYLYAYNNLSASYAWSRRFSTVTSYTVSGVEYEESALKGENRISHLIAQQLRYSVARLTTLTAEYRYKITEYDNGFNDFSSHYLLVGVDHSFSRTLKGSIRAGAEFRDFDNRNSREKPYVEGALNQQIGNLTSLRAYTRIGLDSTELGSYQENFGWRSGVTLNHQFTKDLRGNAGLHYIHSAYSDSPIAADFDEDLISISLGLTYQFYRNLAVYTNYNYTNSSSDNAFRDYDRHRLTLGVSATF